MKQCELTNWVEHLNKNVTLLTSCTQTGFGRAQYNARSKQYLNYLKRDEILSKKLTLNT